MSENLRLWTKAIYGFDHVARLAGDDQWDQASPCAGWTARHVVGHVVAVQRSFERRIHGHEPELDLFVDVERHAGDRPYDTWAAVRDDVLEAVDHPGVLALELPSSRGTQTVGDKLGFNVIDTSIHSWDLARALGVDDRLDPSQVAWALPMCRAAIEPLRAAGMFTEAVPVADDADPQTQLLALAGRDSGR